MKLGIAGTPLPDYESMTDEEIVEIARVGDIDAQEYLINKYKNYVRAKARTYFLLGGDKEDLIQEGMKLSAIFAVTSFPLFEPLRSFVSPGKLSRPLKRPPARSISP